MNKITISGRLTKDPECKEFDGGKAVCDFVVAVNGYKKEDTVYIKSKAWDARARSCSKYCQKGTYVIVSGTLRENAWKDKEGNSRREFYILTSDIEFVQKPQEEKQEAKSDKVENTEKENEVSEEDLETVPF